MSAKMGKFAGWGAVAANISGPQESPLLPQGYLDASQIDALKTLAASLRNHGAVLADEVGMGKTRIAVALALAVKRSGGRVAFVIPPVVAPQWRDEIIKAGESSKDILRSFDGLMREYETDGAARMDDALVILSHRFGDLRAQTSGKRWRADLLKLIVRNVDRKIRNGCRLAQWRMPGVELAANEISKRTEECHLTKTAVEAIVEEFRDLDNRSELDDSRSYRFENHSPELKLLERTLGLALGPFDLVIIDEAHKSRGEWGKLSALLDRVILPRGKACRRLGLTATPVELDVWQWKSTLKRVSMPDRTWMSIESAVLEFREAAEAVRRRWRTDEAAHHRYKAAAAKFQDALAAWVVRRDKRRDETIMLFDRHAPNGMSYRREHPIEVHAGDLSPGWRRIVFAAEALSVIGQAAADTTAARARLTISNGHGVAGIIDKLANRRAGNSSLEDDEADRQQAAEDGAEDGVEASAELTAEQYGVHKRKQRADWWKNALAASFADGTESLYEHPVLSAVVDEIENYTRTGEKVLVFGRFTRPMRVLTDLLNARALLRAVRDGTPWPQEKTSDDDQGVLRAAAKQLELDYDRKRVDDILADAYKAFETQRQTLRNHILALIESGAADQTILLQAMASDKNPSAIVPPLARAAEPFLREETSGARISREAVAKALIQVTDALRERGEGNAQDDELDGISARALWAKLREGLIEEYGAPRASFARMLYGQTLPSTRRLVQLAFNRSESEPHVLIAQSMVGREGLNLHESCRIVILLHLEWNPGVVEQQIGRVDRKNSYWSRLLQEAVDAGSQELPRIEIRPVIFRGTYDEHHWSVLSRRWDEQRSQLHGFIASGDDRENLSDEESRLLQSLEEKSPDFWPKPPAES
ncbi:helicase-related protein [Paracoccus sp. TD-10]|uniref:helicase-related protein n=1 Tax=Paracoccus sp. TD-10 TaxID=3395918 RepID=UPI003AADF49F